VSAGAGGVEGPAGERLAPTEGFLRQRASRTLRGVLMGGDCDREMQLRPDCFLTSRVFRTGSVWFWRSVCLVDSALITGVCGTLLYEQCMVCLDSRLMRLDWSSVRKSDATSQLLTTQLQPDSCPGSSCASLRLLTGCSAPNGTACIAELPGFHKGFLSFPLDVLRHCSCCHGQLWLNLWRSETYRKASNFSVLGPVVPWVLVVGPSMNPVCLPCVEAVLLIRSGQWALVDAAACVLWRSSANAVQTVTLLSSAKYGPCVGGDGAAYEHRARADGLLRSCMLASYSIRAVL